MKKDKAIKEYRDKINKQAKQDQKNYHKHLEEYYEDKLYKEYYKEAPPATSEPFVKP